MLKQARKLWLGGPGMWALAIMVIAPAAAEAQQSGLFPLANIKRERTPCETEDPLYRNYRHEYYGYHPTCWRKFPTGWGCPSPEAPDVKKAFDEAQGGRKLGTPDAMDMDREGAPGPDGGMRGNQPNPGALPALPSGDSPFGIEKPNSGAPRTAPTDPSGLPPATDPPPPDTTVPSRPTPPGDAGSSPGLSLPDPTVSVPSANTNPSLIPPGTTSTAESNSAGFQPTKRRGLISQIFNGQIFRR